MTRESGNAEAVARFYWNNGTAFNEAARNGDKVALAEARDDLETFETVFPDLRGCQRMTALLDNHFPGRVKSAFGDDALRSVGYREVRCGGGMVQATAFLPRVAAEAFKAFCMDAGMEVETDDPIAENDNAFSD